MYKVVERFIQGKQDEAHCEDGVTLSPDFAAVIDGSTSKGDYNWGTNTSGQIARDIISETIRQFQPEITVDEACAIMTAAINSRTKEITGLEARDLPARNRLTASVIIYSDMRKEIWQIGDCRCLVDGILQDNDKPEEAVLATRRAEVLEKRLQEGTDIDSLIKNDTGRAVILNDLRQSCEWQNVKFALIDGTPVYLPGVKITNVSHAKEIVLASDGYPFLYASLAQSERALEEQLRTDPLCIRTFKATKGVRPGFHSFDDRTYVRLRL